MHRVLFVARSDPGGSLYYLARHLRQTSTADARLVTLDPAAHGGPTDISEVGDGGQELQHLIDNADVLHLVDLTPSDRPFGGRLHDQIQQPKGPRVVIQIDRKLSPRSNKALAQAIGEHDWPVIATRPDLRASLLKRLGPAASVDLIPPFVPLGLGPWTPLLPGTRSRVRNNQTIVFASSHTSLRRRPALEQLVDAAEAVSERLPRCKVEVVTGKRHRDVLLRRRRAHLVLTDGKGHINRSGFEALCQGVDVVADLTTSATEAYTQLANGMDPPLLRASALEKHIESIVVDREPRALLRNWAATVVDPSNWLRICATLYAKKRSAKVA